MSILDHIWGECSAADRVWARVAGLSPFGAAERRLMVLQAYIDDSTDKDGTYVLAGYVSTAEKWANFSKEWSEVLPMAVKKTNGHYRFKMSEMSYRGRMADVPIFQNIIRKHAEIAISCVINKNDLKRAFEGLVCYYKVGDRKLHLNTEPYKRLFGNPFYLTFFILVNSFHRAIVINPQMMNIKENVDFIFDDTQDKKLVRDTWDAFIRSTYLSQSGLFGSEPIFESDEVFLPIQAADYLAWWVRKWAINRDRDQQALDFFNDKLTKDVNYLYITISEDVLRKQLVDCLRIFIQETEFCEINNKRLGIKGVFRTNEFELVVESR